jgi:hypothetical protein
MVFEFLNRYYCYFLQFARSLPSLQRSLCLLLIYAHLYTTLGIGAAFATGRVHSFKISEMSAEEVEQHLKQSRLGIASLSDEPIRGLRLKLTQKPKSIEWRLKEGSMSKK